MQPAWNFSPNLLIMVSEMSIFYVGMTATYLCSIMFPDLKAQFFNFCVAQTNCLCGEPDFCSRCPEVKIILKFVWSMCPSILKWLF